ncbi:FecR family protein [Massilibacteroides sp.]|uniref:FecR family protein n=1 Tax=Massilibacteroides sp. TaxID=2034766 RepID=UPI00262D8A65|nr:FecR family protein [Massilibacteroides sp.]MDD4514300.1 FecR family protein [Massilibacteroides sp.]
MDRKILYRFFSGTASFEEEAAVCDWADGSDENKKEIIRERKYFDLLLFRKQEHLYPVKKSNRTNLPYILYKSLMIAAAISVLFVSLLYIYDNINEKLIEAEITDNKITVPPGQRVNLTLSDGTNIWLNACSEMIYPSSFRGEKRIVSLKGEAYFDVAKNEEHPFIVETNKCDIKVLGTKFNVQVDEINCDFAVALLEGAIELTNKLNDEPIVLLSPMQKVELKNGRFFVDSIRDFDSFRWKEGLICFENIQFTELMKRFEKIYDIRIIVQNKALKDYVCSGKCRVADGVDFILHVLRRNRDFSFERNEDNTIIYIE